MQLRYQTYRSPLNQPAQAVVEELWHRFRALDGMPVELMVVQPGRYATFDVIVITRNRPSLTWCWLAYDCLTPAQRREVRIQPFTITECKKDCVLSDLLRQFLGWKGMTNWRT